MLTGANETGTMNDNERLALTATLQRRSRVLCSLIVIGNCAVMLLFDLFGGSYTFLMVMCLVLFWFALLQQIMSFIYFVLLKNLTRAVSKLCGCW